MPVAGAEIPKTSLGKIQRSELGQRLAAGGFDDRLRDVERLLAGDDTVPRWFFRRTWRPKDAATGGARLDARRVLLFTPGGRIGDALCAELRARGADVVEVEAGERWAQRSAGRFVLDAAGPADYRSLVARLGSGAPIEDCIHAWGLAGEPPAAAPNDAEPAQHAGALSAIFLLQAWTAASPQAFALTWASAGVRRVLDGDTLVPPRAGAATIVASAPQELPWLRARHVDVGRHETATVARLVIDEHLAHGVDRDVAWRDGRRFVPGGRCSRRPRPLKRCRSSAAAATS